MVPKVHIGIDMPQHKYSLSSVHFEGFRAYIIRIKRSVHVSLFAPPLAGGWAHLDVLVVVRDRDELGQPLAQPHGDVSVHVDGEGLVALLQATDGEVLQGAYVLAKIHPAHLTNAQTAYRDEPFQNKINLSILVL